MDFLEYYVVFTCIIVIAIFITFSSNCNSLELIDAILFQLQTDVENVLSIKNILKDRFTSGKEICIIMFNNLKYWVKLFLNVHWVGLTYNTL